MNRDGHVCDTAPPGRCRLKYMARGARPAMLVALLAAAVCLGQPAHAEAVGTDPISATAAVRNKAQARFARGYKLFVAKKYEKALAEFRASLEIVASPNARLYVARCLRENGEMVDAYGELEQTEADAKALADRDARYEQTAQSASEERADLAKSLALITFAVSRATPNTTVKLGHEEIQPGAWENVRPVMPGTVEVTVHTPPDPPKRQTLTLAAGETKTVEIEAVAPPPPPPPVVAVAPPPPPRAAEKLRPFAYVAGGIGVAGVLTFAIAGAMSNATYSGLKSDCNDGPCPPSRANDVSTGRTQQTIANVGLVVGLVGIAAGTTLFIVSAKDKTDTSRSQASIVVGPGWLGVRGEM
jgi:hypothetical protein